ncbi:hypothetical protein [Glutamicibacter creatinolyticus]
MAEEQFCEALAAEQEREQAMHLWAEENAHKYPGMSFGEVLEHAAVALRP